MQSEEWLSVAQAAMQIGKTRQAIEGLVRKHQIEAKPMGQRKTLHVHLPTLMLHYAKKSDASFDKIAASKSNNLHNTAQSDATYECKRLSDLLAISERLLAKTESELHKERERTQTLQNELINNMKEIQAFLKKESGLTSWIRTLRK